MGLEINRGEERLDFFVDGRIVCDLNCGRQKNDRNRQLKKRSENLSFYVSSHVVVETKAPVIK